MKEEAGRGAPRRSVQWWTLGEGTAMEIHGGCRLAGTSLYWCDAS